MGQQNVVYTLQLNNTSLKEEGNSGACHNMAEPLKTLWQVK